MSTQEDRDRVADMKSRYAYKENSNLVTHGNNEPDSRGPKDEATGEVHSLVGKIDTMRMGDRVSRSTTKAALAISNNLEVKQARSRQGYYKSDVVSKQAYAGAYQPKSNETRSSYDGFLSYIALAIGDQPPEVLAGAAEEVLITLKNPKIHDKKRREEVEELLGALDSTRYQALMNLSRRLTDFNLGQEEEEDLETMKMRKQEEEEYGINVELDDEDDDIVANAGLEQGISRYAIDIQNEDNDPDLANQETISTAKSSSDKASGQTKFDPRDVDAYWVQRQIAKFTDDPHLAQTRGERVLTILEEELGDPANVENRIMSIVDYQNFEFVRLIRDNATEIYWCTKLARADDATKNQIRVEMHKQPELKEILNRLESTKADLDEDAAGGKKEAEGTVKTEDSSVLMKRRTMLDLDGMSFENGSHLMANKECMLPDGTERTTRVGYELVKVPARAAEAPNPSELIPIKELPLYAQAAFEGYKSLNRIQSRIAETALKDLFFLLTLFFYWHSRIEA